MPPLLELEEAVTVAASTLRRWATDEAVISAAGAAPRELNLLDAIGGTAAKLDSGTAELSATKFPKLNQSADFTFQVRSGNELRSVNVHLPPNFDPAKPTPTYFLMDGAQYGDPEGEMLDGYHWAHTADRNGIAAISLVQSEASKLALPPKLASLFPEHSVWRNGFGLVDPSSHVNDMLYFDNVLSGVKRAMNVEKINVVGFCDGGCFAHGLATRMDLNGVATVGSTVFKDVSPLPLPGTRGFFATMQDDAILPQAGGPGRSFGKFLVKSGHTKILQSTPLEQGALYARVDGLIHGETTITGEGVESNWIKPGTAQVRVKELSLNEGGHNWPGTRFSSLSHAKAEQTSPDAARALNQKIVDFFETPRSPWLL